MPHRLRGRKGRKLLSLKYGPQKPIPFGVEKGYGRTRGFCGDESAYQPSIHWSEPRASTLKAGGLLAERRDASRQVHTPQPQLILPSVLGIVSFCGLARPSVPPWEQSAISAINNCCAASWQRHSSVRTGSGLQCDAMRRGRPRPSAMR